MQDAVSVLLRVVAQHHRDAIHGVESLRAPRSYLLRANMDPPNRWWNEPQQSSANDCGVQDVAPYLQLSSCIKSAAQHYN